MNEKQINGLAIIQNNVLSTGKATKEHQEGGGESVH